MDSSTIDASRQLQRRKLTTSSIARGFFYKAINNRMRQQPLRDRKGRGLMCCHDNVLHVFSFSAYSDSFPLRGEFPEAALSVSLPLPTTGRGAVIKRKWRERSPLVVHSTTINKHGARANAGAMSGRRLRRRPTLPRRLPGMSWLAGVSGRRQRGR